MEGALEVFSALFRLMKSRGLLTEDEYQTLLESMGRYGYESFVVAVNNICKDEVRKDEETNE